MAEPVSNLRAGEHCGEYELLAFIGRGGMAQVWSARSLKTGETVAIKTLLPPYVGNATLQERLAREGQSQNQLQHPNILRAHGTFHWKGSCFMVMDLVDGESLEKYVLRRRLMPVPEVRGVAQSVLSALAHAHQNNIVHRDVKPSNILLSRQGRILLGDFGIALLQNATRLTRLGSMGTPSFMSPEQIVGKHIDHLTDIYSVGCVLYELLSGVPPFCAEGSDANDVIRNAHQFKAPEPLMPKNPEVTTALEVAVLRALEKNPQARFQSCAEMAAALGVSIQLKNKAVEPKAEVAPATAGFASARPVAAGSAERSGQRTPARSTPLVQMPRLATPASQANSAAEYPQGPRLTAGRGTSMARTSHGAEPIAGFAGKGRLKSRWPEFAGIAAIALALILAGVAVWRWKNPPRAYEPAPSTVTNAVPGNSPQQSLPVLQNSSGGKLPGGAAGQAQPQGSEDRSRTGSGDADVPADEPVAARSADSQRPVAERVPADATADVMRDRHPPPLGPRPGVAARTSGVLQWAGTRGENVEIEGSAANSGTLTGDPLPGVPVRLWLEGEGGSLIALPSEADGYRRLIMRAANGRARIHWKVVATPPAK